MLAKIYLYYVLYSGCVNTLFGIAVISVVLLGGICLVSLLQIAGRDWDWEEDILPILKLWKTKLIISTIFTTVILSAMLPTADQFKTILTLIMVDKTIEATGNSLDKYVSKNPDTNLNPDTVWEVIDNVITKVKEETKNEK